VQKRKQSEGEEKRKRELKTVRENLLFQGGTGEIERYKGKGRIRLVASSHDLGGVVHKREGT